MSLSVSIESPTGSPKQIERHILLARLAILWERVWPRLWPVSGILVAFAGLAALGFFTWTPGLLHALLLIAGTSAIGYFLWRNFQDFRWPGWSEGARRLERESGLPHRPITERDDRMAAGQGDTLTESLWRAHMRAQLAAQHRLRLAVPRASFAADDPFYLRYALLLLLAIGLLVAGREAPHRIVAALTPGGAVPAPTVEAWIDPPPYTGEAPVYLRTGQRDVAVPAGSTLALRVHGARIGPRALITPRSPRAPAFTGNGDDYSGNAKVTRSETVGIVAGVQQLASWRIKSIPDQAPSVAFAQPPSPTERDSVKFAFTAGDDYGVVSARALIRPAHHDKNVRTLIVDLPLSSQGKTVNDTVYRDLTGDPYAGLEVSIVLEAKDAVGNVGRSKPVRFTLPARVFTNPLARALVEQRQSLFLNGVAGRNTATLALDALTVAPDAFYADQTGVYVALRAAYWGLNHARGPQEIAHVEDLLWQTALGLERGGLSSAAEELRRLQQMISQALAQGAPQSVLDSLLQRYQDALNRYLQDMAQNPPQAGQPVPKGAKVLKPGDLQALLKAIQQLAQSGARGQAQQLLSMLQSLLENLHMTAGSRGSGSEGDKALGDALKGLGDLMGKQRQLLDKTFREQQGNPDSKAGGPKGLSQNQGGLRQELNKLMQQLGPKAGKGAKDLGEAGKQMGEAQGKLGERALDNATEAERNALDAMRKGAGQLAQQMMQQQGSGKQGENGDEDPLGRENGGRGSSFGNQTRLPSKAQLDRARNILKELRRRAEERGRPQDELDYIDRLLKQF